MFLKQSTAATIKFGPFIDTDGAALTSLTISQADIRLSKNGGDSAQTNNAAGAAHDENGYYDVPLNTTDTNTVGRLKVMVSESGALPVWAECEVLSDRAWWAHIGGTFNERGGKIIYAHVSSGSSSNPGTRAQPFDTAANAIAAAVPGDTVWLLGGSWSTAINVNVACVELTGDGDATVITVTGTTPAITVGAHGVTISRLKAVATNATQGVAILADAKHGVTIDNVTAQGTFDGIELWNGCKNGKILNSRISATFDGLNCYQSQVYCFNCEISSDGSFNSGSSLAGAVVASGGCIAEFENCRLHCLRTVSSSIQMYALLAQDDSATKRSTITLQGCELRATSAHASATCTVYGITWAEWFGGQPIHATLRDCTIYTSINGTQSEFSINANNAGSEVFIERTNVDASKINGVDNCVFNDGPLRPTVRNRQANFDASGVGRAFDADGNAIATLAEQAKIPKSDGTVAPNATAIAAMQSGLATASALGDVASDAADAKMAAEATESTTASIDTNVLGLVTGVNVIEVAGNAGAATKLGASADTMIIGTINDANFTPTVTEFRVTGIADAEEDQYVNRRIIVTSGDLIRQVTSIAASELIGGETHFTVSPALTQALADGETVLVV